ncbi:glycosyltransferase family 4 protein [Alienimonas chondri]|uniref:D-inositol-3-phosphate glycosyltransferase n=1 Tax=Alienimonas chondri TaxID=2681879 RepID=A0ABX1VJ10_9PLAN|nr:glycosyltransferase family 4 protein [Alienimonas chondri]NNJ28123.1 D-inositol-3-phosphate glycosyltransferase [Alienimonas chondri]
MPLSPPAKPLVAVAFEYPSVHGGERSLLAVCDRLRERFELVALAPPTGALAETLSAAGWPVVGCDVKEEASLRAALERVRPALLHGNSLSVGRVLGRLANGGADGASRPLPCPVTAHLRDILNLSKAALRDLGQCAALVAVSAATRDHHVARGLPADRATVVHNGIDPQWATPASRGVYPPGPVSAANRKGSVRNELHLPADAPLLLTIGQIGLRKGWDVLAEAAAGIASNPPPHFVMVGERWSTKAESVRFEEDVFALLERSAPGRVHRLGTRSDVPRLMAAADLLVHPARQEPFGRVLLEAAAAGLPIVATEVGGTREMLGDAFAAVPPGDAAALATTVTQLLASENERTRLAAAGRRRIERFTVERSAAGLAAVWDAALGAI